MLQATHLGVFFGTNQSERKDKKRIDILLSNKSQTLIYHGITKKLFFLHFLKYAQIASIKNNYNIK